MSRKKTTSIPQEAVAIICPGQGFWPGSVFQLPDWINEIIKEITGVDLIEQCQLRGKEVLKDTRLSQLLSLSVGYIEGTKKIKEMGVTKGRLKEKSVKLYVLGHSVGEYTALVLAHSVSFPKAVSLVWERSGGMQKASKKSLGRMSAILGKLKRRAIKMACRRHDISVAADNSQDQLVVSGRHENMDALAEELAQSGQGIARALNTEGAFHSPLMKDVEEGLRKKLAKVRFKSPLRGIRFISTVTGKRVRRIGFNHKVKTNLIKQLVGEVKFRMAMLYILEKDPQCSTVEAWPIPVLSSVIQSCKEEADTKRLAQSSKKRARGKSASGTTQD